MKGSKVVGMFDCPYCRVCFPTHYRSKKDDRWVSGASNFMRHRDRCRRIWDAEQHDKMEPVSLGEGYYAVPRCGPLLIGSRSWLKRIWERLSIWWYEVKLALAGIPAPW